MPRKKKELFIPNVELQALCDLSTKLAELCSLASGSEKAGDAHGVGVRVRRAIDLIRDLRHAGAHAEVKFPAHPLPPLGRDGDFILPEEV